MGKQIIAQVFTGGFKGGAADFERTRGALDTGVTQLGVRKIITGWTPDRGFYERIREFLDGKGVELYLWLPVFSEIGLLADSFLLVGYDGRGVGGYASKEDENFEFYCPNRNENIENALNVLFDYFPIDAFDGVFLDKIRYPTFANGFSGVASCFCEACRGEYDREGFDCRAFADLVRDTYGGKIGFGVSSYANSLYGFENGLWERFFALRAKFVTRAVGRVIEGIKNRRPGLRIGLDTLAPFAAYFAGQDIPALSALCDFVKPMMYRITNAPAGMPFELSRMEAACGSSDSRQFRRALRLDSAAPPFPLDFCGREWAYLTGRVKSPLYAGIEINRIPGVADADPAYIRENIEAFDQWGADGFVLSWDLLSAPKENIDAAAQAIVR